MPGRASRAALAVLLATAATAAIGGTASAHPAASAPTCFGKKPSIVVTAKNKTVTLSKKNKNTVIDLLGKGDSVNAGKAKGYTYVCDTGGAKKITTGDGNDKVSIKNGNTTVSTGKGNDTFIQTGTGNPTVHLGAGNDTATLAKGNGVLYGEDGNDTLMIGKSGHQKATGGHGRDTLVAGAATSTLDGNDGGTNYVVPTAYTSRTTVVLHPGDTVNGKDPNPPAPPAVPLPTGAVVVLNAYGSSTANAVQAGQQAQVKLAGLAAAGHTLSRWALDFGDGSPVHTGVGLPPSAVAHTWWTAGNATAVLTLADEAGRTSTATAAVSIASAPAASLSITSATGYPAHQTSTTVSGSLIAAAAAGAHITGTTLDYGDGSAPATVTGSSFSHAYAAVGRYTVGLYVYDDHGGFASAGAQVNVVDSAVHITLVNGDGVPQSTSILGEGGTVVFDLSRSTGSTDGSLSSLTIDPGDGSGSHAVPASGRYSDYGYSKGAYTATVSATSHGTTVSKQFAVYVANSSSGAIGGPGSPITVAAGQPVTLTAHHTLGSTPTGGPANAVVTEAIGWGDESADSPLTGGATQATHVYATPGVYDVGDFLTDTYGGPNSTSLTPVVVTGAAPQLTFTLGAAGSPWAGTIVSPSVASQKTYADLTGVGSTGHVLAAAYRVDWGDSSTPDTGTAGSAGYVDDSFLQHAYLTPGEFTAVATLTDGSGQTATVVQHVSVSAAPTLTTGTPSQSGQTVTVPAVADSPGAGAVANTWQCQATDASYNYYTAAGNGLPPATVTITLPSFVTATGVTCSVSSDHGGYASVSNTL